MLSVTKKLELLRKYANLQTKEECLTAVREDGLAYWCLPEEFKLDADIALAAINNNSQVAKLCKVCSPAIYQLTRDRCMLVSAIIKDLDTMVSLDHHVLENRHLSSEDIQRVFESNPDLILKFCEFTTEACKTAMYNVLILPTMKSWVYENRLKLAEMTHLIPLLPLTTDEIFEICKTNEQSLPYLGSLTPAQEEYLRIHCPHFPIYLKHYQTKEWCYNMHYKIDDIGAIKPEFFTPEFSWLVLRTRPMVIIHIPGATKEMWDYAFERNNACISHMPDEYITEERVISAIQNGPREQLAHIPEKWRTPKACTVAMSRCVGNIMHIPNPSPEMWLQASQCPITLALALDRMDPALVNQAITKYPHYLRHIQHQTLAICTTAVINDPSAIEYVEPKYLEACAKLIDLY